MVKNITKIAVVALMATVVGSATARCNFGFSFGCQQPVYYAPAPVVYNPPSVGFGFGDANFGIGFNVPLCPRPARVIQPVHVVQPVQVVHQAPARVVKLDNEGKDYWRFFNNTGTKIIVIAIDAYGDQVDRVVIRDGESDVVMRQDSFNFEVKIKHGQLVKGKCRNHNVYVNVDDFDDLYCSTK